MKSLKRFFKHKIKYFIAVALVLSLFVLGSFASSASSVSDDGVLYRPFTSVLFEVFTGDDSLDSAHYALNLSVPFYDDDDFGFDDSSNSLPIYSQFDLLDTKTFLELNGSLEGYDLDLPSYYSYNFNLHGLDQLFYPSFIRLSASDFYLYADLESSLWYVDFGLDGFNSDFLSSAIATYTFSFAGSTEIHSFTTEELLNPNSLEFYFSLTQELYSNLFEDEDFTNLVYIHSFSLDFVLVEDWFFIGDDISFDFEISTLDYYNFYTMRVKDLDGLVVPTPDPPDGSANPAIPLLNYTEWLGTAASGFLDLEIFPNFTLGGIFMTVLAFTLVVWFLKLLAGG